MSFREIFFRIIILFLLTSAGCFHSLQLFGGLRPAISPVQPEKPEELNSALKGLLTIDDIVNSRLLVDQLLKLINSGGIDDRVLSESYYLTGIYFLKVRLYQEAIHYLDLCLSLKEKMNEQDVRYARTLYNLGIAYASIADLSKFEHYALKSLEIGKIVYQESDPALLNSYLTVASAFSELHEYEKAISNSNSALLLAEKYPESVSPETLSDLYYTLGVCYIRQADFSKAKLYFEKSESYCRNRSDQYINIMNVLGYACNALGITDQAELYYKKGAGLAVTANSSLAYNIINSYSLFLASNGKAEKGEKLLKEALDRSRKDINNNPDAYYEVLNNYAGYLRESNIDIARSIQCYRECLGYIRENDRKLLLRSAVYIGYARSLENAGEFEDALGVIQYLLNQKGEYENPSIETLKPDLANLKILKLKHNLLWDIHRQSGNIKTLEAASNTSELVVSLLDKVRINISEEESRLVLGDKYRDSYLSAIRDFNILYKETADKNYLAKAFEYAEKSKAAGLLASTRELKAAQFHVPPELGNLERELQNKISFTSARIDEVMAEKQPDMPLVASWKENLFIFSRIRDSLIRVLENDYPGYYAIKYNSQKVDFEDIPVIFGRSGNYLNYVVGEDELYIFIVNRKTQQLLSITVDSSFFNDLKKFRNLLTMPSYSDNAAMEFQEFQETGYRLYKLLVEPVRPWLISDKVIISSDNLLSYLPFEIFPSTPPAGGSINYKNIQYLMRDIDISYTYSATFMSESVKKEKNLTNNLIAFAPDYPEPIDIQSVLLSRQAVSGVLNDLPYARQEAEFVSGITGGSYFMNRQALESVYKNESGKYDIIHLAMHTLLNDRDPMRSMLIFSHADDFPEDGNLKTYEIYGIPLKAKMVVLSSCNTGAGFLSSGEGILSLARGFIYSGSQSVVMSMWEIEDKSGTEIVKKFYENLKKGNSKNTALKNARIDFLKNADKLRAHPYFWSSLVVYGDNSSLYPDSRLKIFAFSSGLLLLLAAVYFYRRKYS